MYFSMYLLTLILKSTEVENALGPIATMTSFSNYAIILYTEMITTTRRNKISQKEIYTTRELNPGAQKRMCKGAKEGRTCRPLMLSSR